MIADKIKFLREEKGLTQSDLAKKLGITRSSVNAWEMGISIPSTQYLVELAYIFKVSTDYLLGIDKNATIGTEGLTDDDIRVVYGIVEHLKDKNNFKNKQAVCTKQTAFKPTTDHACRQACATGKTILLILIVLSLAILYTYSLNNAIVFPISFLF